MDPLSIILAALCLAFAAGYVLAEWKESRSLAVAAKIAASTCFVVLAIQNGAIDSDGGRMVLLALLLSWLGDALLLSWRENLLLAGIAVFLLAHVAFAWAFASIGTNSNILTLALVAWANIAVILIRWLSRYLKGVFFFAVTAYLIVIVIMASLAAATGLPILGVAAALFAISDISVARDRFVKQTIVNKIWGIPLYYLAQVLFAVSISQIK